MIQLGSSSLRVSPLMIGCWSFGSEDGGYWGEQKQSDVNDLVSKALDMEINFFDTAVAYNNGKSESSLGIALKGKRERAIICNKINVVDKDKLPNFETIFKESLNRLDTDYVDLMMIHWPHKDGELLKANIEAFLKLKEKGLIREIGVSNFGVATMKIAKECGVNIACNEFGYNLLCRGIEKEILPYCLENKIDILAYSPLMQGILTGKYTKVTEIPYSRRRTVHFSKMENPDSLHGRPGADAEMEQLFKDLKSLSDETGIASSTLALGWVKSQKGVSCVIAGCRNIDQLLENYRSLDVKLSDDIISRLYQISQPVIDKVIDCLDIYRGIENGRVW